MPLGRYSDDDTSPPSPGRPSAARHPPLLTSNHPPPTPSSSSRLPLARTPPLPPSLLPPSRQPCCALSVSPFPKSANLGERPRGSSGVPPRRCYTTLLHTLLLLPPSTLFRAPVLLNGENYQMRFPSGSKHAPRLLLATRSLNARI